MTPRSPCRRGLGRLARDVTLTTLLLGLVLAGSLRLQLALSASAPSPPWEQTGGPVGGCIETIEMHPHDPNVLYAGGVGGSLFKTTNRGTSWRQIGQPVPNNQVIRDLLIDPTDPAVMYVVAGHISKSADGGRIWTIVFGERPVSCMAMDSARPTRLALGTWDGRILLTADGGVTWKDITGNLPIQRATDIAFRGPNELWVGISGANGHLYHSVNDGDAWTPDYLGQSPSSYIQSIFVDPGEQDTVYVGLANVRNRMFEPRSDAYLVKTVNGGADWVALRLPWTDAMVNVLGRAPGDNMLYVATGGAVFQSPDGGQTWTQVRQHIDTGDVYDLAVDRDDPRTLYLAPRAYGILKSTDRGQTWEIITEGLLNTAVSLLALASPSGSTLYASSVGGEGTFKSADYGRTWTRVNEGGITHPWADELVASPTDAQTIWEVADVGQAYVSTDGGRSWEMRVNPRLNGTGFRTATASALAVSPSDPDVIYGLKAGFGLFRSPSGGEYWSFLDQSEVDYTYALAVHPTNPDVVLSGYDPKPFQDWAMLRRSADGGQTWSTVLNVPRSAGIRSVAFDPNDPSVVYAGSTGLAGNGGGRIYRSTDEGRSWSELNPHFTMLTVWGQPQLVGDPVHPSTVYAATWLGGTWKTDDAGLTWDLLEEAPVSSTSLCLDKGNPDVIYSGDRTAPYVWKSSDSGLTWTKIADFRASGAYLANRVVTAGGAVYAATFGPDLHGGRLYKSTTAGANWSEVTNGLPRSVLDVAADPSNAQVVYATTHIYGAYKTTDGGDTWTQLAAFPDIGGYDIEVDPVSPNTIYAAGLGAMAVPSWVMPPEGHVFRDASGVYKSTDGGGTWSSILTTSNECRAIRIDPSDHNRLFAAALSDGLKVSRDGGKTWQAYNSGLDTLALTSTWMGGDKVYAGTQGFGIYSGDVDQDDGTVTWRAERSNKPVPSVYSLSVQVQPGNSRCILVSANPGGLFRSDDGGATFYDKNFLTPSVIVEDPMRQGYYPFAINPQTPSEVWIGTWGKGVYKSYDGMDFDIGASGSRGEMYGKHVNALLVTSTYGVLVATEEGIWRTTDGGRTWTDFGAGIGTSQIRTLQVASDGRLFCGTAGYEIYNRQPGDSAWRQAQAFDNCGTIWPVWNNRPLYQYTSLLFHPTDPETIYIGTFPAGIFKSLDGGATWRERNVGFLNDGVFALVSHPGDPEIIYAGTYNGLSRSLDGAAHWEKWNRGWPGEQWVFSIAFDPHNSDVMYACSKNGENEGTGRPGFHGTVMKSTDGGNSWWAITNGLDVDQEFYKIIVDKRDPDVLYLATQYEGVFISHSGGVRWEAWNDGLTNVTAGTNGNNVTNTMALSSNGRYLYFGTMGSGVFRRQAATWTDAYAALPPDTSTASQWAQSEIAEAWSLGLTTEDILWAYQTSVTREEFCELAVLLWEKLTGGVAQPVSPDPFADTSNPAILRAFGLGITTGVSPTRFGPESRVTRQEMCVMLYRALEAAGRDLDTGVAGLPPFADQSLIASWAVAQVRFCHAHGIMKGITPNTIGPLGYTTREQAICLVKRTFERFR